MGRDDGTRGSSIGCEIDWIGSAVFWFTTLLAAGSVTAIGVSILSFVGTSFGDFVASGSLLFVSPMSSSESSNSIFVTGSRANCERMALARACSSSNSKIEYCFSPVKWVGVLCISQFIGLLNIIELPVGFPLASVAGAFGSDGFPVVAVLAAAADGAAFLLDFDECFLLFFDLFNSSSESDDISSKDMCSVFIHPENERKNPLKTFEHEIQWNCIDIHLQYSLHLTRLSPTIPCRSDILWHLWSMLNVSSKFPAILRGKFPAAPRVSFSVGAIHCSRLAKNDSFDIYLQEIRDDWVDCFRLQRAEYLSHQFHPIVHIMLQRMQIDGFTFHQNNRHRFLLLRLFLFVFGRHFSSRQFQTKRQFQFAISAKLWCFMQLANRCVSC